MVLRTTEYYHRSHTQSCAGISVEGARPRKKNILCESDEVRRRGWGEETDPELQAQTMLSRSTATTPRLLSFYSFFPVTSPDSGSGSNSLSGTLYATFSPLAFSSLPSSPNSPFSSPSLLPPKPGRLFVPNLSLKSKVPWDGVTMFYMEAGHFPCCIGI